MTISGPTLRRLLEATDALAVVVDADGRVQLCTSTLASLFSTEAKDWIGHPAIELGATLLASQLQTVESWRLLFLPDATNGLSEGEADSCTLTLTNSRAVSVRIEPIEKGNAYFFRPQSVSQLGVERPLVDTIPGLVYRCRNDAAWSFDLVSAGAFDLCGYLPDDFLLGEITLGHDVILPADRERVWDTVQAAIAVPQPFEIEYRIVHRDGSVRWAWERGRGVFDDADHLVALEGLIVDVTSSQVMREELRYARYLLRAVYDASPDAILIFSEKGEVLDANEYFTRLFKYTPDALHRFDALRLLSREEDRLRSMEMALRVLDGEEPDFELDMVDEDGLVIPVEARLRRFEDDIGRRFVVALVRDLRDKRAAEAELRTSEQRYRQMFEGNHAIKLLIDPADGSLIDVNDAAVTFYGYSRSELLAMKIQEINALSTSDVEYALASAQQQDGTHFEFRHRRRDGSIVDVEVHTGPIFIEGRRLLYSIVHDISERRRLEKELRASQRMEALGRLAGGIAHDFNNLMTVVSASAALAFRELDEDSEARSHLTQIRAAARRAAELTRQLLAFGRRQVLEPHVVSLHNVIEGVDTMVEGLLGGTRIRFERDLGAEAPFVRIDSAGMEQVLINLVLNARDAVGDDGVITLSTRVVDLQENVAVVADVRPGRYVVMALEDNGEGIQDENLPSIFDPFFTTKPSGTGLGLSSVYGTVKQSGGHITVDSELGRGTRFELFLPLVSELERSTPTTVAPSPRTPDVSGLPSPAMPEPTLPQTGAGLPVALVVDDNDVVRRLMVMLLEADGWNVFSANGGAEALEAAGAFDGAIDVLVTDIRMPGIDGRELAKRMNEIRPSTRILFVSGWVDDIPLTVAPHEGSAFLQKPPDPEELSRTMRALLAQGATVGGVDSHTPDNACDDASDNASDDASDNVPNGR